MIYIYTTTQSQPLLELKKCQIRFIGQKRVSSDWQPPIFHLTQNRKNKYMHEQELTTYDVFSMLLLPKKTFYKSSRGPKHTNYKILD